MNSCLFRAWIVGILFAAGLSGCASVAPRQVVLPAPVEVPIVSAFVHPLPGGRIISPFGQRGLRTHTGVDLQKKAGGGDLVVAVRAGTVSMAQRRQGYGLTVVIKHPDGSQTRYAHLQKLLVDAGQPVIAGQQIGIVGATGRASTPHLHFEVVTAEGRFVDPFAFLEAIPPAGQPREKGPELAVSGNEFSVHEMKFSGKGLAEETDDKILSVPESGAGQVDRRGQTLK